MLKSVKTCAAHSGPYMLLNGARSAPEAKFLPISSKSSKVPKLMQLRRILKIFKSLGLPAFKPSKHILKFENPPKPQKFSNLRIVLNPRGRPRFKTPRAVLNVLPFTCTIWHYFFASFTSAPPFTVLPLLPIFFALFTASFTTWFLILFLINNSNLYL